MIGSFWNLCRACPSMPVDKLHSEYRSTYRWHEYRSGAGAGAALGGDDHTSSAPAATNNNASAPPLPNNVVRRAPLPSQNGVGPRAPSIEPAMPRRKKYPGLAYKTNEIFEAAAAGLPSSMVRDTGGSYTLDRARSMERTKYLASRGERRSKSEGPRNAQQANGPRTWTDTVEEKATSPSIAEKKRSGSEYRNQFAWPREDPSAAGAGATSGAGTGGESAPRKSVSMGTLKAAQPGGARRRIAEGGATELEPLMNHTDDDCDGKKFIEDYQKPGEGPQREPDPSVKEKMLPKAQSVPKSGAPQHAADNKGPQTQPQPADTAAPAKDGGDSWYREVLDLRKLAGEYKYRGWGTELAPDHLTEIYNKQMDLWYQVSRRSSLSALSLASTNHRAISKEEKDKENENKNRTSPKKPKSFRSAPHQSIHAKLQESRQQETPAQRNQRKKLQGHSFDNNSVSEGKGSASAGRSSARTSPRKQLNLVIGGRGSSVEPASGDFGPRTEYRSPKRRPRSADPKPHQPMGNGPLEDKRRPSKPSDDDAIPLRSGSAFREHRLLDDTPVVKSPPEPTRVKSPEQMNMRSPDPVNWTVPLDTGKTFTVTQNVKSDDLIKRPGSDFKGAWGGDDHSASMSAALEQGDSVSVSAAKASPHQGMPSADMATA